MTDQFCLPFRKNRAREVWITNFVSLFPLEFQLNGHENTAEEGKTISSMEAKAVGKDTTP